MRSKYTARGEHAQNSMGSNVNIHVTNNIIVHALIHINRDIKR